MSPALSLQKRFPGRTVARIKIWFAGHSIGIDGPIPDELARLIAVVWSNPDPAVLAEIQAIVVRLQGAKAKPPSKAPSDRALRKKVSKARSAGKLGAR